MYTYIFSPYHVIPLAFHKNTFEKSAVHLCISFSLCVDRSGANIWAHADWIDSPHPRIIEAPKEENADGLIKHEGSRFVAYTTFFPLSIKTLAIHLNI